MHSASVLMTLTNTRITGRESERSPSSERMCRNGKVVIHYQITVNGTFEAPHPRRGSD
jgi:hypothetical protein